MIECNIKDLNKVIEIIKKDSGEGYNLEKAFNDEYSNHCSCAGSDINFLFKWEDKVYGITNNFIITEDDEIEDNFEIIY